MQKYFISKEELKNKCILGDDVFHITKVMRSKVNDQVIVSDEEKEFLVKLTNLTKNEVYFEIVEEIKDTTELPFKIDLYQGYPKSDKLEYVIKHGVELGIYNIYPTFTKRSNIKLDKDRYEHKLKRFNKIAKESAEQSNRRYLTKVVDIVNLKDVDFNRYDHVVVCYEEEGKSRGFSQLKNIVKKFEENQRIAIVVGPEGGFDDEEVKDLMNNSRATIVGLGKRILKTQVCILYVLSAISYEWEL